MKPLARSTGWFRWVLPLMLGLTATSVLLSQRNLSLSFADLAGLTEAVPSPAASWLQRGASLLVLLVCAERFASQIARRARPPSMPLTAAYVTFWLGTVASPALLGAHRQMTHDYVYALVIGLAGLLVTAQEIERVIDRARDALFVLMLVSVCFVVIQPTLVLDESYTQGLLPGVPRLGGLAPHPVALGTLAQIGLLLAWARPYRSRWLNLPAWALGLAVLFFAQSKTAWIAFVLCAIAMLAVRRVPPMWRRLADPGEGAFGIAVCLGVMVTGVAVLALALSGGVSTGLGDFLDSDQGAQLMTLTGRDQIWAVAWEEWDAHKWFGYGPGLFDDDFRLAIHMPNATNAHNQFMDTLARSGAVGAAALAAYAAVLLVLSLRYARRTGGLSAALFVAIALRAVSEVPLALFGYGTEFFVHLLLLVTLSAAASMRTQATAARPRTAWGVPA